MKTVFLICILFLSSCGRIPAINGSGDAAPVIEVAFSRSSTVQFGLRRRSWKSKSEYKYYVCRANQWTYLE